VNKSVLDDSTVGGLTAAFFFLDAFSVLSDVTLIADTHRDERRKDRTNTVFAKVTACTSGRALVCARFECTVRSTFFHAGGRLRPVTNTVSVRIDNSWELSETGIHERFVDSAKDRVVQTDVKDTVGFESFGELRQSGRTSCENTRYLGNKGTLLLDVIFLTGWEFIKSSIAFFRFSVPHPIS